MKNKYLEDNENKTQWQTLQKTGWTNYDTWWILMSGGFWTYMAKGDRGFLRPSYGQPKLTFVSTFVVS